MDGVGNPPFFSLRLSHIFPFLFANGFHIPLALFFFYSTDSRRPLIARFAINFSRNKVQNKKIILQFPKERATLEITNAIANKLRGHNFFPYLFPFPIHFSD
jgi:hypothetical protein